MKSRDERRAEIERFETAWANLLGALRLNPAGHVWAAVIAPLIVPLYLIGRVIVWLERVIWLRGEDGPRAS